MNKVKWYNEACHTCLKTKPKYKKNRPIYGRIPVDYAPMQDFSIDIKHTPTAFGGYQYLLVIMCDETNLWQSIILRPSISQISRSIIEKMIQLINHCHVMNIKWTKMV